MQHLYTSACDWTATSDEKLTVRWTRRDEGRRDLPVYALAKQLTDRPKANGDLGRPPPVRLMQYDLLPTEVHKQDCTRMA